MNIGKNIKKLRRSKKISLEDLADKIGVSRNSLSKWEKGFSEPKVSDAKSIAEFFRVPIEKLILDDIKIAGTDFENNIEKIKRLSTSNFYNEKDERLEEDRLIPLINPANIDSYKAFKRAYKLNIYMEENDDISNFVEMMNLYEKAFNNGFLEAGINILNVIVGIMVSIKNATPEHDLIFEDKLMEYIEELEEVEHPGGEFFRAYAIANGLINNGKSEEENLDDGMIMMYTIAHKGNKFAKDLIKKIESTVD